MKRALKFGSLALLLIILLGGGGFYYWMTSETAPMPKGSSFYIRFDRQLPLLGVLKKLQEKSVIRNADALHYFAMFKHAPEIVPDGTYTVQAGFGPSEVLAMLRKPIVQMVRIPETNLSYRTANWLQKHQVLEAKDYREMIKAPAEFQQAVDFPLPKTSLEGYLYPDTYDLPPLYGAKNTIVKQLSAFKEKVEPLLKDVKDPNRVLTIASMVELEAAFDGDRPLIAGVIENRLAKGMPLQIDATILFALGKWRRLTFADYKYTISEYNTYLHKGLPPGPICSPSLKSVEAALHPAKHEFLYYVAMPNGHHAFAKTYEDHVKNIAKRKELLKAAQKA